MNAAYLVDPVDNTKYSPEGEEYPSGVKALKRLGKPVGITGAGIMGRCNPEGSNYKVFSCASLCAAPPTKMQSCACLAPFRQSCFKIT